MENQNPNPNPIIPITQPNPNPRPPSPLPPMIVHQDNFAFPNSIILDDTNYSLWSPLMEMHISACNKAGYLTGEAKRLASEDPNLGIWLIENQRVKS